MRVIALLGLLALTACATAPAKDPIAVTPVVSHVSDDSLNTQLETADRLFAGQDYAGAFDAYRAMYHIVPPSYHKRAHIHLALAESALKLSHSRPKLADYAGILYSEIADDHPNCQVWAGLALTAKPETLSDVIMTCTDDARLWNARGRQLDKKGHWIEAVEAYVKALALTHKSGGNPAPILNNLGMSLLMQSRADEAAVKFDQARRRDPDQPTYDNNYRLALIQAGRIGIALEGVTDKRAAEIFNDAGYIAQQQGRVKKARAYYKKALELSPAYFELAANNLANLDAPIPDNRSTPREQIVQALLLGMAP